MNLTFQKTVESNTSDEWETLHSIFGSYFATVVLPTLFFIIFLFGAAGNVAVLFKILNTNVSDAFTGKQMICFVLLTKIYAVVHNVTTVIHCRYFFVETFTNGANTTLT